MNIAAAANFDAVAALTGSRAASANTMPAAAITAALAALKQLASTQNSASTPDLASAQDKTALAALLARILQASTNTATAGNAPTAASNAAIILTELLNPTNAAAMDLNLNQLLNSAVLPNATTQLPTELLAKPQVIEALVLQNTLLPEGDASGENSSLPLLQLPSSSPSQNSGTVSALNTTALYRVSVQWQNRILQLLSPQPLPANTRVPLQIAVNGTIALLRPEIAAKILLAQNTDSNNAITQPSAPPTPAQTIQQSLRELLPRQQALNTLVPMLQKFIAPAAREQLPQPIFKAVAQLLQSLPKPAQLNTAENVRQAINNSGSFLEAKLAQAATSAPNAEPLPNIAATDIKAQINILLALIRPYLPQPGATKPNIAQTNPQFVAEDNFVYAKPTAQAAPSANAHVSEKASLDSLVSQLGKLLEAGFARIQLNQLDSAAPRHVNPQTQTPVPTWVLELPLRTPHGVDQLQLRIEQRRKQQQKNTRVQWNVDIAFDLHSAGKLAVSLAIVDKSVAATLWAEREQTHLRVREEMNYLRAGLESVGVNVTEMQCRLGLPAPRVNPISQQLVDVHT